MDDGDFNRILNTFSSALSSLNVSFHIHSIPVNKKKMRVNNWLYNIFLKWVWFHASIGTGASCVRATSDVIALLRDKGLMLLIFFFFYCDAFILYKERVYNKRVQRRYIPARSSTSIVSRERRLVLGCYAIREGRGRERHFYCYIIDNRRKDSSLAINQ